MLIALYLAAIVAANLTVTAWGPSASIVNAFLFVGLDLVARDRLHDRWRGHALAPRMALLIVAGGLLSMALNAAAWRIAVASSLAFVAAATVDALTYHALHRRPYLQRVNGSNIASAAVDSILFPTLAFGALLPRVIAGQFAAKVAGGALWALLLRQPRISTTDRSQAHAHPL